MTQSISVLNTDIRLHDGLYSLNDLHRTAGGEQRHKPGNWLRIDQTRELIEEIEQCSDLSTAPIKTVNGGKAPGTYACKELVYAYAMWISAKFHLSDIIVAAHTDPGARSRAWWALRRHFGVEHYRDIPAARFEEALAFVKQLRLTTEHDGQGGRPEMLKHLTPTGGHMTVLMTIEGDHITHMQPLNEGEVVIDPARLPDNIHAILPGWRLVPVRDLEAITRLALASLELFDGIEITKDKLRDTATRLREWVH
jgi:hypothetical protein